MPESVALEAIDGLRLRLVAGKAGLRRIEFRGAGESDAASNDQDNLRPLLDEAARQLRAYFKGSLRVFDLPLELSGTSFQTRVWQLLEKIPYGRTRSYRDLAVELGMPLAVRAVGAANGANPLPIAIPCHRVIGSNGRLVGYGGGLPFKKRLLALEQSFAGGLQLS